MSTAFKVSTATAIVAVPAARAIYLHIINVHQMLQLLVKSDCSVSRAEIVSKTCQAYLKWNCARYLLEVFKTFS
jgi:hypothetical protein